MTPFDTAMTGASPSAVEVRIIQRRVRPDAGASAGEWVADAVLGTDSGPSDGPRPLRISEIEWIGADHQVASVPVAGDATFGPDDVAALLDEARRRRLRVTVWAETDRRSGGTMVQSGSFFDRSGPVSAPSPVSIVPTPDGIVVTVDESVPPQRWWLLMYPVLIVSFAWVFFLVIGALPRMLRDIGRRATTGVTHRWVATLDAERLVIDVDHAESDEQRIEIARADLIAVGAALGFCAYTTAGAVPLPGAWLTGNADDRSSITDGVARSLDAALVPG
jgi:hypothetical protein